MNEIVLTRLLDNAFRAYENCKNTSSWGKQYWENVISTLMRKYNRLM